MMLSKRVKSRVSRVLDCVSGILEKCGGPGSGIPGPCPSGHSEKPGHQTSRHPSSKLDPDYDKKPESFVGKPANPAGKSSLEKYQNPDGSWTPERQKLHNNIIQQLMEKSQATPVEKPVAYFMGGGPASGKSTVLRTGQLKFPANKVTVEADEIKTMLPEYHTLTASGDKMAACFVHTESQYIAARLLDIATREKKNTLVDGMGDSTVEDVKMKVNDARAAGRKVEANYVTVDVVEALHRSKKRMIATGRGIPPSVVKRAHREVSRIVPRLIESGTFDRLRVFDNNGNKPKLIAESEGSKLTVHDQNLWNRFLSKGK